jgi:ribose transport system ATP-binding protein
VTPSAPRPPVLALRDVSKAFGGVPALSGVSLEIEEGEVHGLLGENGSGKSTLIKILSGYHAPEPGARLELNGTAVPLPLEPGRFRELGLSFVHQDLGLVPALTVVENMMVGDVARRRALARMDWRERLRRTGEALERFEVDIDPRVPVHALSQIDRARLAIVRALEEMRTSQRAAGGRRGVLVLDEPTVFLPRESVDALFALVRSVVKGHASVLFVSHDLPEVFAITDRVTVLRDGRVRATVRTAETSHDELVRLIVGHDLSSRAPAVARTGERARDVRVRGATGGGVSDVSFALAPGEIVGLTGLIGSGFDEVPYLVSGARRATAGTIMCDGREHALRAMRPRQALELGVALVPGDRQRLGSVGSLSLAENVPLPVIDACRERGVVSRRGMVRRTTELVERYDIRPRDPLKLYGTLSGGNQQKALIAKWLQLEPRLLLVHEPTQGVDVGAREQIFGLLRAAAGRGMSVVCASADYEQLALLCTRVLVFRGRRIATELDRDVRQERIAEQVYAALAAPEDPGEARAADA